MRSYLITDIEEKIIQEYLESGKRLEGFRTLKHRVKNVNLEKITEQVELIQKFRDKMKD